MVNLLLLHQGVAQKGAVELSRESNMIIEVWYPLTPITQMKDDERVLKMTRKYDKSIV